MSSFRHATMPFCRGGHNGRRGHDHMVRQGELRRLHVIQKVLERVIKQVEAAEILFLSGGQIRRIVKRISDETVRGWLIEAGDWKKSRKRGKHRQWRERKHHFGEMVQMDGSHHAWFEDRGGPCVLMSYIDDANGEVFARFYGYEGTIPAMDSLKRYIKKNGLPLKVYLDKHSTYKSTAKPTIEDELNDVGPLSEFERALKELGVEVSHAHSPQAKGRIERLFRTFRDRALKEMRLRGIRSIEEGNRFLGEYLPLYNKRFSVCPREKDDVHRPLPRGLDLNAILCIKTERTLRNDFTVAHNHKLSRIEEATKASK